MTNGGKDDEQQLQMNEVVMQPGAGALILPSYWFHSIIGLTQLLVGWNTDILHKGIFNHVATT
jgi:hypothetical protein